MSKVLNTTNVADVYDEMLCVEEYVEGVGWMELTDYPVYNVLMGWELLKRLKSEDGWKHNRRLKCYGGREHVLFYLNDAGDLITR